MPASDRRDGELTFTVDADAGGQRLDKWLATATPILSRVRMRTLIESGCVLADRSIVTNPRSPVRPGQTYRVVLSEDQACPADPAPSLAGNVLFQDDHLIVIDKPPGMVVHSGAGHRGGTLAAALVRHVGPQQARIGQADRPGIVHRLDKDTSGVLIAATSQRVYRALVDMFAIHAVERQYLAYTCGALTPLAGEITVAIDRDRRDFRRMAASDAEPSARSARTRYRTLCSFGQSASGASASLVCCRLHTGRTHQIRVHLSHMGAPVIGDGLYGGRRGIRLPPGSSSKVLVGLRSFPRQALHACRLGFVHPVTSETMCFESPLPGDMRALGAMLSDTLGSREVDSERARDVLRS